MQGIKSEEGQGWIGQARTRRVNFDLMRTGPPTMELMATDGMREAPVGTDFAHRSRALKAWEQRAI
jgi:hypothetical protein